MCTVYILKSLRSGRYYIGSTTNLGRRLKEHNLGKTKSLKYSRPLEVVFSQDYNSAEEARKVEYKLKSFKSREIIERIIKDKIINLGS
ncbi:GIY-YIG nuclease family protein [Patescibacteria group bacterium]|nr:GIY-YIG nuclease family protein [Patescibacteria group bacterium]MCL5409566.1 GIY-YIG nuclease family protein [Patescibacteria group bacterium]